VNSCPSADDLEKFLEEQLSEACRQDVSDHVNSCAECQEALERLTEPSLPAVHGRAVTLGPARARFGAGRRRLVPPASAGGPPA
jgi:anti-sigma factor RsiW